MAKVIVERPRYGSRARSAQKGYQKRLQRMPLEDAPRREGIRKLKGHTKFLNEHLGPLRRYLRKQVGRAWDEVFSEICEHIRVDSAVQSHVRDHVDDYVETKVIEVDGVLCHGGERRVGRPLGDAGTAFLYVCPRTGKLRLIKRAKQSAPAQPVVRVQQDAGCEYRKIEGIWYELLLRPIAGAESVVRDVVHLRPLRDLTTSDLRRAYGHDVYAARRRQLNKRELRKLGLENAQLEA